LLESETHTSIKRVGASRKADASPIPAIAATTNRDAALTSFVPQDLGFFCALDSIRIACKPGRL
jgi:hypothetical protein